MPPSDLLLSSDLGPDQFNRPEQAEAEAAYRQKVLRSFFKNGKLVQIPAQRKKKDVVLHHLAQLFEPGRHYPEREVNAMLGEYHPDFFTLRRELVGLGLLDRAEGLYWRTDQRQEVGVIPL